MARIARSISASVSILFEGERIEAQAGDSVAAALLAAGYRDLRTTPITGAPRGPLCMMGVCFDCLVEIDSAGNRQACIVEVREGMKISRQVGAFDSGSDGLADPDKNEGLL